MTPGAVVGWFMAGALFVLGAAVAMRLLAAMSLLQLALAVLDRIEWSGFVADRDCDPGFGCPECEGEKPREVGGRRVGGQHARGCDIAALLRARRMLTDQPWAYLGMVWRTSQARRAWRQRRAAAEVWR